LKLHRLATANDCLRVAEPRASRPCPRRARAHCMRISKAISMNIRNRAMSTGHKASPSQQSIRDRQIRASSASREEKSSRVPRAARPQTRPCDVEPSRPTVALIRRLALTPFRLGRAVDGLHIPHLSGSGWVVTTNRQSARAARRCGAASFS
jgi:hypothetical protein